MAQSPCVFGALDLPLDRVPEVTAVLDRHPIRYYVSEGWMTVGDSPRFTTNHFRRGNDYKYIQSVLDAEFNAIPAP